MEDINRPQTVVDLSDNPEKLPDEHIGNIFQARNIVRSEETCLSANIRILFLNLLNSIPDS